MPLVERIQTLAVEAEEHAPDSFAKTYGFIQGGLTAVLRHELNEATAEAVSDLLEVAWVAFQTENKKK